jgi:hypothetical protein
MSKTFSEKIPRKSTKLPMSFFRLLCFIAFSGVSLRWRWEFKSTTKNVFKKIVSKSFYQKIDKKSQTDFFSVLFYHVFGRFSVRGVQKHDKKSRKKTDQPRYFFGRRGTNQPRRGPSHFVLSAPWPLGRGRRRPLDMPCPIPYCTALALAPRGCCAFRAPRLSLQRLHSFIQ